MTAAMALNKHLQIPTSTGFAVHAYLSTPENAHADKLVILSHGFITTGTENHGMFMRASRRLNRSGFSTILYDQIGTGYSDGNYPDFSVRRGVEVLDSVIQFAVSQLGFSSLILFGQSLGTAISALVLDERSDVVESCVYWNFSDRIISRYRELFDERMGKGEQVCIPHKGYFVSGSIFEGITDTSASEAVLSHRKPTLFLNSGNDRIGSKVIAKQLASLESNFEYREVAGASHDFVNQPELEEEALDTSIEWLNSLPCR